MKKRNSFIMIILFLLSFVFSGCASLDYRKPLNSSIQPKASKSYLYGRFFLQRDFMNKWRLALRFENITNGNIISIRLLNEKPVYAVEIDPGTYRLKDIVYAPLGAMMDFEITKLTVPSEPAYLHNSITVEPGKIYYLGDFSGSSRRVGFGTGVSGDAFAVCVLFKGGLVGVEQNFSTTTEEIKRLLPQLTDLEFNPAW
ncbi:MAG: hypothetical protein KAI43_01935 [Candidatus Aureabacteria bacterium]|nr:hypothetical protein [Candidatus Auribacterota bacterium]